jgi:hypothetical protein
MSDEHLSANESGFEGVACVDDAARLLDVLCDVWAATKLPWAERWARGLLDFLLWMQEEDGRWINFVYSWDGQRNEKGITSETGENFWHARALVGVSHAWLTFEDERAEAAMHRGLDHAVTKAAAADVRALHIHAATRLARDAGIGTLVPAIRQWCHELVECREDGVLKNSTYETGAPHLWAHIQEGVLAESASLVNEPSLIEVAAASASVLIAPVVEAGFDAPSVAPYDVASCIWSLDRLAAATGNPGWTRLAGLAREWFDGRNPAGTPAYDTSRGRVADGVDDGRLNHNSGAESNVVTAEILMDRAIAVARSMDSPAF